MVLEVIADKLLPAALSGLFQEQFQEHLYIALTIFSLVASLLIWRVLRFTIIPRFYPDDPKELPYWIPIVGHGVAFFKNSNRLLNYAKNYFSREIYAVTVAGSKLYIITDPKDVTAAYKNMNTLSFDEFVRDMMRTSGSSEFVIKKMYETPDPTKEIFPNPHNKPLAKLARELHNYQLYPGPQLDDLLRVFVDYFDRKLSLEELSKSSYTKNESGNSITMPLYIWASDIMITGGQEAYFGPQLAELEPNLTWDFLVFDDLTWQVLFQYPKFLASTMYSAKAKVTAGLKRYFTLPQEERKKSSWFTPAMEAEMRNLEFNTHEIAIMMTIIYWGINTNSRRVCFWVFNYMLQQPGLMAIVREETKGAFLDGKRPDIKILEEECPYLNAIWNETVRLSAYSSSVRYIIKDTMIGGKLLRKGNRVMIPNRQLHFNEKVFGSDVYDFKSERFVNNEVLLKASSWRPYGGGITICPGRFIAKQSVISFVAMVLHRFDVEVAGPQRFPKMEEGKPVLGIMSVEEGNDLAIRLTPKKKA